MAWGPGTTELMRLWRDDDLSQEQRVALLLGGSTRAVERGWSSLC